MGLKGDRGRSQVPDIREAELWCTQGQLLQGEGMVQGTLGPRRHNRDMLGTYIACAAFTQKPDVPVQAGGEPSPSVEVAVI